MATIRDRILARAELDVLRAARDITALAAALNAEVPPVMVAKQNFITARAVMAFCVDGVAILTALQSAAANPAVGWALQFLGQEAGLDIGDPYTQAMVTQLAAAGVLSADQAEQLKALSLVPVVVTQEQVSTEMYNPDGTEK
jgi:hypothetical protein